MPDGRDNAGTFSASGRIRAVHVGCNWKSGSTLEDHILDGVASQIMSHNDARMKRRTLRQRIQGLPVALMTAYARSPLLVAARKAGVKVFSKPLSIQELVGFLKSEIP